MKNYIINDNGKVRICNSNIAKMNLFEWMYYRRYTMTISTQCLECKHYTGLCTCEAFPDKIPQEIFDGSYK